MATRVAGWCLVGLAVAGCGGPQGSDRERIAGAVTKFERGIAEADGDRACDALTDDAAEKAFQNAAPDPDCAVRIAAFAKRLTPAVRHDYAAKKRFRIRVIEDIAYATARTRRTEAEYRLEKVDGDWRIDSLPNGAPLGG